MKGFHKKYTLACQALSPIHIGSGEELSRWEYVIIKNKLYFTTDEFWELLFNSAEKAIIDEILRQINFSNSSSLTEIFHTLPNSTNLINTLKSANLNFEPLRDKKNKPLIRNIHRFTGAPNYYLPGSSIKGALRGAYEISKISKEKFTEKNIYLDIYTENEINEFYSNLELEFENYSEIDSEISKIFQKIRIEDINISEKQMNIIPVSFEKDKNKKKQSNVNFFECIKYNSEFELNLTIVNNNDFEINTVLYKIFKFYEDKFNRLYNQSQNTDLHVFYKKAYDFMMLKENIDGKKHSLNLLRCGFGTGQFCNSILPTWQKHSSDDTRFWQGKAKQLLREGKMKAGDLYPSAPKKDLSEIDYKPLGWIWVKKITSS